MIGIFLAIGLLCLLSFIYYRCLQYFKFNSKIKKVGSIILGFYFFGGFASLIFGFLLSKGELKHLLSSLGYYWLGTLLYFAIALGICLLVRACIYRHRKYNINIARHITCIVVIIFTIIMSTYGILNAHDLKVTNYEINVDKKADVDELNIVLIADIHYGYNVGLKETRDMVNAINDLDADVVIIAGDIFDNEYDAIYEPEQIVNELKKIKSKYGVYATYGNHDIEEKIFLGFTFNHKNLKDKIAGEAMIKFIKDSNIEVLYDDYKEIEGVYIYGRPDYEKPNLNNETRLSNEEMMAKMDKNKPIIVIDHEPRYAKELSELGVDVLLNGHTHDGQVWPGTLTINLIWDNAYGYKQYGNLHNIVTSGVGLFGVNMRTDSIAEVCNIKIKFN